MVRSDGADRRFHVVCVKGRQTRFFGAQIGSCPDDLSDAWRILKKRAPWAGARGTAKINPGQNCPFLCAGPETRTHVYFIAA